MCAREREKVCVCERERDCVKKRGKFWFKKEILYVRKRESVIDIGKNVIDVGFWQIFVKL